MTALSTLLLALALAVRALVPAGWMPSAAGGFAITLCTGMGVETGWLDAKGAFHKGEPAPDAPKADQPCAFAGLAAPFTPGEPPTAVTPRAMLALAAAPTASGLVRIGAGLPAPPPPSTGPPSLI